MVLGDYISGHDVYGDGGVWMAHVAAVAERKLRAAWDARVCVCDSMKMTTRARQVLKWEEFLECDGKRV